MSSIILDAGNTKVNKKTSPHPYGTDILVGGERPQTSKQMDRSCNFRRGLVSDHSLNRQGIA